MIVIVILGGSPFTQGVLFSAVQGDVSVQVTVGMSVYVRARLVKREGETSNDIFTWKQEKEHQQEQARVSKRRTYSLLQY